MSSLKRFYFPAVAATLLGLALAFPVVPARAQNFLESNSSTGPVRLRSTEWQNSDPQADPRDRDAQKGSSRDDQYDRALRRRAEATNGRDADRSGPRSVDPVRYVPSEFERFVQKLAEPADIRRFGAELVTPRDDADNSIVDYNPQIPPDYLVKPGDEVMITLWGSVDADVRAVVDRSGRIVIPRVGPVLVQGMRYAELPDAISRRVAQVFRNFQLSVSLGQLRGVRVYVTGFVANPGSYSVSSLATVVQALLRAGGPSAAGSFRDVQLRRNGQAVASFDLYDFLLKGDRSADRTLQPDDVIHVGPIGPQVALIGSVNRPAVFELKAGDMIADVLRMAGGFNAVADRSRLAVERLEDRNGVLVTQLSLPADSATPLTNGEILRAFSAVDSVLSVQRQNKRVRVEGEVARPGEYVLPPTSNVADALAAAGGLTPSAYLFGTEFSRQSVRETQQENYERALRDLETDFTRNTSTRRTTTADEAAAQTASQSATARLIERLRSVRPTGRVVLQIDPAAGQLPNLAVENGDRLFVPVRPTTVGVFGSVFNAGSYLYRDGRGVEDFLRLAGGPTRGADKGSVFVIRANGSVISALQRGGWFRAGNLDGLTAEPGDTIFVPEELDKTTFIQNAKDWTQIFSQFGLGIAAIKALNN